MNEKLSPEDADRIAKLSDFIQAATVTYVATNKLLDDYFTIPDKGWYDHHWQIKKMNSQLPGIIKNAEREVDAIRRFFLHG